jgi:uncharacterized protein (DUF488 family)
MTRVVTIGAIGWTAGSFFDALTDSGVRTLCDIRRRRAMRGREYAFANSRRLQERLEELGIAYVHRLDLAPTQAERDMQAAADRSAGIALRSRQKLSNEYIAAYRAEHLAGFDARRFIEEVGSRGDFSLFCVEREPAACHRSLVAAALRPAGVEVEHLVP